MLSFALASAEPCVSVLVAGDAALQTRVRDEVAASVALPLGDDCATTVAFDASTLRLRVDAASVVPATVLQETLRPMPASATALHIAEVVRGVLLEVEVRERKAAVSPLPQAFSEAEPAPVAAPPPASTPLWPRLEASLGGGALWSFGGLNPGLTVGAAATWRVSPTWGVSGAFVAPALSASRAVEEGVIRVDAFGATLQAHGRRALGPVELFASAGLAGWWVQARGVPTGANVGGRGALLKLGGALAVGARWPLGAHLGLWARVDGALVPARLALDVNGRTAATLGPAWVLTSLGVDTSW